MTHLKGRCDCGRTIHYPKWARYGHRWTCQDCGRVWILSRDGEPLERTYSKPPEVPHAKKKAAGRARDAFGSASWFMLRVLVLVLIALCVAARMAANVALPALERLYLRSVQNMEERILGKDGVRTAEIPEDAASRE